MLPTDAPGLHCSRELVQRCIEFVNSCIAWCRFRDTKPCPLFDQETEYVQAVTAYSYLSLLERTIPPRHAKLLSLWNTLIEQHYGLLSYGSIQGGCREWVWTVHRKDLMQALGLGLIMERLVIEKRPGMGVGVTPRAEWTLRSEVLLFASDAQLYAIENRPVLQRRMSELHVHAYTQAIPLLKKQFEF